MNLRQSGNGEYLGGIEYAGGVEDPAVWNHFQAEGRLRNNSVDRQRRLRAR